MLEKIYEMAFCAMNINPHLGKIKDRHREIVIAKFIFYYIAHINSYTLVDISKITGCTHATVINGIKRIEDFMEVGYEDIILPVMVARRLLEEYKLKSEYELIKRIEILEKEIEIINFQLKYTKNGKYKTEVKDGTSLCQ